MANPRFPPTPPLYQPCEKYTSRDTSVMLAYDQTAQHARHPGTHHAPHILKSRSLMPAWGPPHPVPPQPAWLLEKKSMLSCFFTLLLHTQSFTQGAPGNVRTCVVLTTGSASWHCVVGTKDTAHHPTMPRTAPQKMIQPVFSAAEEP